MRKTIRPRIELRVGQPLVADLHRHGLRRALGLLLEELVHAALRQVDRRCVPLLEQLPALVWREQRQPRDRLRRVRDDALQQRAPMAHHPLDRRAVEQIGRVQGTHAQTALSLFYPDRQVEFRALADSLAEELHGESRELEIAGGHVPQHQRDLEQRIARQIALRMQLLHELLERQVLVRVRIQRTRAHPRQILAKLGSPDRSPRSTSVFTKKPISPSISRRVRPAMGTPTAMSSCPL